MNVLGNVKFSSDLNSVMIHHMTFKDPVDKLNKHYDNEEIDCFDNLDKLFDLELLLNNNIYLLISILNNIIYYIKYD